MKILVIEDEEKMSGIIRKGLEEEGYQVEPAFDGEEGFAKACEGSFDLIILDLMLPRMDGISVCRQIRGRGITSPVIMLTAKDTVLDKVTGLDAGADDYLTKPFAFEELLARIRALSRKTKPAVETKLYAADLVLDQILRKVFRNGKEIELSSKEFSLLEFLLQNQGSVVTRAMINEKIWEPDTDPNTNVIDVYINFLRNKIDKDASQKLIHTVRGSGYMLKI
jgi:DNA-binding response OmpR family regulator